MKLILYLCNIVTFYIFQRNPFLPAEISEYQKGRGDPVVTPKYGPTGGRRCKELAELYGAALSVVPYPLRKRAKVSLAGLGIWGRVVPGRARE